MLDRNGGFVDDWSFGVVRQYRLEKETAGTVTGTIEYPGELHTFSKDDDSGQEAGVVVGRSDLRGYARQGTLLWYADAGTNTIGVSDSKSTFDREFSVPRAAAGLSGLAITDDRYVWVAETQFGRVLRLDAGVLAQTDRIGGADRYEVAVNLSRGSDLYDSATVFIVSGETFADASASAPSRETSTVGCSSRRETACRPRYVPSSCDSIRPRSSSWAAPLRCHPEWNQH